VAQALSDVPEAKYLFAGSGGYGFIATIGDLLSRVKAGKAFMSLEEGEEPVKPAKMNGGTLNAITAAGRLLLFPVAEIPEMSKGRGNKIIELDKKDTLAAVLVNYGNSLSIEGIGRSGKGTRTAIEGKALDNHRGKRANKGQFIESRIKPTGLA
jgi:topoisomerase-4 subunit A